MTKGEGSRDSFEYLTWIGYNEGRIVCTGARGIRMQENLQAACLQLISEEDLAISKEIAKTLEKKGMAASLKSRREPSIKIFSEKELALSDILPIITDYGLRVLSEVTFVTRLKQKDIYVSKFLIDPEKPGQLKAHKKNIIESLLKVLKEESFESCKLFRLIYREDFCARGILLFRTIVHYENQLVAEFNISHIIDTLIKYHHISKYFLDYFDSKFTPQLSGRNEKMLQSTESIQVAFKEVESADEDRILKLFFAILENLLRTNYYMDKKAIAIKIDTRALKPALYGLQPNSEIFVYSNAFRGLHLRMDLVSRGGLRYSSRTDDYRTEIKDLMAAQEGKNAIIIPSGAKGGFVINKAKSRLSPEEFQACYTLFVDALLDMVDNKEDEQIVRDAKIVAYDKADTYFVVAADRGTSSMSDVANAISLKRHFWIGDAFASGGSNGFHHKKLGITAKGALRSVQRFFIEKGIDFYRKPITVVGIGSMSGDVFGNGMIESDKFKLVAAISHDEIFVDPSPDPERSCQERKRLFAARQAKWSNYDKSKISKGGGVFRRDDREIRISSEIARLLQTRVKYLSGEKLANLLLKLPVDMIYNGGVGTYVKATAESNITVGDKENEYIRVDAEELRAFCFCEGGNLGLTQAARLEYAKNGGLINLDSIDNAAGVNTSDHEVNLKIILNRLVKDGSIKEEEKDTQLKALSKPVVESVLQSNYLQSLAISLDQIRSKKRKDEFITVVEILEHHLDVFERRYFMIPRNSEFDEVLDSRGRILRPILSVTILYAKIFLKRVLLQNNIYEKDHFFEKYLLKYFPKQFVAVYENEILAHPLKREIISMMIANSVINQAGALFLSDFNELDNEKFLCKIKSYLITNQLYNAEEIRLELYRNDYRIDSSLQYRLLLKLEEEINYNMTWMLKSLQNEEIRFAPILEYRESIHKVIETMRITHKELIPGNDTINTFFEHLNLLKFATAILKITKTTGFSFTESATVFYHIIQKFEIALLIEKAESIVLNTPNDTLLRLQLQQLIEYLVVDLTREILRYKREKEETGTVLANYLKTKAFNFQHYEKMLKYLKSHEQITVSDLSITVNYLLFIKN